MSEESRLWQPIEDLPLNWLDLKNSQNEALLAAWFEQAAELRQTEAYDQFLMRLRRQWAIETGVLERLYCLSDGVTKTLIEKGLDAAIICHEDTNRNPADVIAMIQDQLDVVNGLYRFISAERPLGTSYIKELHRVLTAHQVTYDARDTLGQYIQTDLPKGEWKRLPNNVEGPGDYVFEFCPPEQVDSEMERLLAMHAVHEEEWNVPPYIEAAWLHHRFTLIHPFTDGNGRVARCLATLVFLKAQWFPLVLTRSDREEYITALRQADKGDLRRLVHLFAALQGKAVREAFSLSEELRFEQVAVGNILRAVKEKFSRVREEAATKKQQVLVTADTLHSIAAERLRDLAVEVSEAIRPEGKGFSAYCSQATRRDDHADYHYFQIVQCARTLGYYANAQVYRSWVDLVMLTDSRSEILLSFHGMGKGVTGIMACSAMFYTKESTDTGETAIGEVVPLSDEPFTFTYDEDPNDVGRRFREWLDERLILGLDRWRKVLGA